MKLKQVFFLSKIRRLVAYSLLVFVGISLLVLVTNELRNKKEVKVNYLFAQFSLIKFFALYYIPPFLLVVNSESVMDNYLIISKYSDIKNWWEKKVKILLTDVMIYLFLFAIPLFFAIIINAKKISFLNFKVWLFILEYFFNVYMIFAIVGVIYLISSLIFKKQYVAFVIGFFVGSLDFLLCIFKLFKLASTTSGMLINFILAFNFPLAKFLILSVVYCGYFALFFILLNFVSCSILKRIDLFRGDIKSES